MPKSQLEKYFEELTTPELLQQSSPAELICGSFPAAQPDLRDSQMSSLGSFPAARMPNAPATWDVQMAIPEAEPQMPTNAQEPAPKRQLVAMPPWLSSRAADEFFTPPTASPDGVFHWQASLAPAGVYDLTADAPRTDASVVAARTADGRASRTGPMGKQQYIFAMDIPCVTIDESDGGGDSDADVEGSDDESDDDMLRLLEEEGSDDEFFTPATARPDEEDAERISTSSESGTESSNVGIVDPQVFADGGSMADRAHMIGVPTRSFRKIKRFNLPLAFCSALWWLSRSAQIMQQHDLRLAEYFAGVRSICRGCRGEGIPAASYELKEADTDEQNLLSHAGMVWATQLARRLVPRRSVQWWAPVCSTWVSMNLGTSMRTEQRWWGDTHQEEVAQANEMVWKMVCIVLYGLSLGFIFIIEQPASSLMLRHPAMILLKHFCSPKNGGRFRQTSTFLGMFGASTQKQIKPFSNWSRTSRLQRKFKNVGQFDSEGVTRSYVDASGKRKCCGGKRLKETQAYPDAFGKEVGRLMAQFGANDLIDTESEGTDDTDLSSDSEASGNFEDFPRRLHGWNPRGAGR